MTTQRRGRKQHTVSFLLPVYEEALRRSKAMDPPPRKRGVRPDENFSRYVNEVLDGHHKARPYHDPAPFLADVNPDVLRGLRQIKIHDPALWERGLCLLAGAAARPDLAQVVKHLVLLLSLDSGQRPTRAGSTRRLPPTRRGDRANGTE